MKVKNRPPLCSEGDEGEWAMVKMVRGKLPISSFSAKAGNPENQKVMKQPAVYLLASQRNGTLYVGVTSDLVHRVWQHRTNAMEGFSKKYHVHLLVWFEQHSSMEFAIIREKAIKKWNRTWKLDLIVKSNPEWQDLWPIINGWSLENQE